MTASRKPRDQIKVGNCVIAERRSRARSPYSKALHRLREIDRLIADRFGQFVPAEHLEGFLTVAAFCHGGTTSATLDWCHRFAPYAVLAFDQAFEPIRRRIEGRRWNLNVEEAGRLLALTFDERQRLQIKTMWAADMPVEDQKGAIDRARQERDRLQKAAKRKAKRKPRADWLAEHLTHRQQPWKAEGISRATYYRRLKPKNETGVSHPAHRNETGVSQIENPSGVLHTVADTLVSPSIAPDLHDLMTAADTSSRRRAAPRRAAPIGQLDLFDCEEPK